MKKEEMSIMLAQQALKIASLERQPYFMAQSLKSIHDDFMDSIDDEPGAELCEIYRNHIASIFSVLEKYGIDLHV